MTRLFLLPLFLAVALIGCDAVGPADAPLAAPAAASSCTNETGSIAGPRFVAPGAQNTYTASVSGGCPVVSVTWSVTNGATVVSTSGDDAVIQAGTASFTITATISYGEDYLTQATKQITLP